MKRGFGVLFLLIFLIGTLSAIEGISNQDINQLSCGSFEASKETFVGMEIPEQIPYKNEVFNVYLGGIIFGNLEIEESTIKDFSCTETEDMTYSIYIEDYSTLSDFIGTEDPIKLLKEKLKTKEIQVKGASLGKKLKWSFTRFGLNFMKMFVKS